MINVKLVDMPVGVKSFVRLKDDCPTIVINARLSYEQQKRCYRHEVKHITNNDFEQFSVDVIEMEAHGNVKE